MKTAFSDQVARSCPKEARDESRFKRPVRRNGQLGNTEVDPGNRTRGLVGETAVPLLNGADDDEEKQTED